MALDTSSLKPLLTYFYKWEKEDPDRLFLRQPSVSEWKTWTYREAGLEARKMAAALQARDYPKGTHIGILSKNCAHWILADLAILMGGYVSTPLFPNLASEELSSLLAQSECKVLFAGKLEDWHGDAVPDTVEVVSFPHYKGNAKVDLGTGWDELISDQEALEGEPLPELSDLWTILFTSGTTGKPKGVMHPHENAAVILANENENHDLGVLDLSENRFFSFLPLNHVAERIAIECACFLVGGSISFAESLDTFATNLQETRPTFFFAVPRIWTKFQSGVFGKISEGMLKFLFFIPIVNALIKGKILKGMGLDAAEVVLTGAAPTPEGLKNWYQKLGLNLREVYGMTETCGAATVMPRKKSKPGTVGKPVSSVEVSTDSETGELKVKMPWQMTGYFKDEERTEEILKDGWIHTGDKAEIDEEGFIRIVGRVKDTFKTAKGKFIIPATIEGAFDQHSYIEQICVVGRGLPQPIALILLSDTGKGKDKSSVRDTILEEMKEANQKLPGYKRLSTVVILTDEWTVDNQFLTPTLKVRRVKVDEAYADEYEAWHGKKEKLIWQS